MNRFKFVGFDSTAIRSKQLYKL